jgi:hypothetical protein
MCPLATRFLFRLLVERAVCHLEHTSTGSMTARVSRATIGRSIGIVLVQSDEGLQVPADILNELGESVVHVAGLLIRERFSAPIMGGGDEHLLDDEETSTERLALVSDVRSTVMSHRRNLLLLKGCAMDRPANARV